MGRLINTDHICFRCSYDGDCMSSIDKCRKCYYYVCDFEDIEDTPTAYDVEKVVAELGKNIECSTEVKDSMCQKYADCFRCLMDRAIKIVRKGGV